MRAIPPLTPRGGTQSVDLLRTRGGRRLLFTLLYLGEGIPIGFLWWALPTMLRDAGVPVDQIGLFSAVLVIPWAFKFAWAPLVDAARFTRFGLKGCIAVTQTAMALTLVPLAWIDLGTGFGALVPWLLAHALAAATQDAAIDALAIAGVPGSERGMLNGFMQAGMLVGRGALGGGALMAAAFWGTRAVVLPMAGSLAALLLLCLAWRLPEPVPARDRRRPIGDLLRGALSRGSTWVALGFAALAGAGFEATGVLAGPLLVDRGYAPESVGRFYALPAVAAMAAGALAGGWAADRLGRRRTVAASQITLSLFILVLAFLARPAGALPPVAAWTALTAIYLGIGLFTASSYALFMDLTDRRLGATQFSAYMGATNACESWAAGLGGRLAAGPGYPAALAALTVLSLLALPLLRWLGPADGRGSGRDGA